MLTPAQIDAYEGAGHLVLPGAIAPDEAARMRQRLWAHLERAHDLRPDEPETWNQERVSGFQSLQRNGVFDALGSPTVCAALDDLLGPERWRRPTHWGGPLVTFPVAGAPAWDVPSAMWHLDVPARGPLEPRLGAKLLALLTPMAPGGGATLLLEGSHRLVRRLVAPGFDGNSVDVRRRLARAHPWFADLIGKAANGDRVRRFMRDGAVLDEIPVRVVEFTGEPGDVLCFDPWLFHAPSPNTRNEPRLMLGENLQTPESLAVYARPKPGRRRRSGPGGGAGAERSGSAG